MPRTSSREPDRCRPPRTALANERVWSARSQSPNSLVTWNWATRVMAAWVTASASSTGSAPWRRASVSASAIAWGSSPRDGFDEGRSAVPLGRLDVGGKDVGEFLERFFQDFHQVDRAAPGVGFLHAAGVGVAAGEGADDRLGEVPAGDVEGFEGLVGEVEHVAAGQVAVVGGGGEEHVGDGGLVDSGLNGREQAAFGAGGVAHVDEAPEPALEGGRVGGGVGQGADFELGRRSGGVAGYVRQPVEEGARVLLRRQVGEQVHHAGQDREAGAPAVALVAGAELEPDAERLARVGAALDERDGGLSDDQREVLLKAGAQAAAVVSQLVAAVAQVDPDVAVDDCRRECGYVVGPQVESAAGRHVKARVMPVAGEDAVVDAAAIEGEAHVGAAVVQGVNAVAVPDEHQGAAARAHSVAGSGGEIAQTPGVGESIGRHRSILQPCGTQ